jgi:hypothetical protein
MVGIQRIKVYRNPVTLCVLPDSKEEIGNIISPDLVTGFLHVSTADIPTP